MNKDSDMPFKGLGLMFGVTVGFSVFTLVMAFLLSGTLNVRVNNLENKTTMSTFRDDRLEDLISLHSERLSDVELSIRRLKMKGGSL